MMLKQIRTIACYTLLEALRNRLTWLIVIVAFTAIGLSGFLNEIALTEKHEIQLAMLAAFLRVSAVFLLATFVVTSMVREINDKGLELVLGLPLQRSTYLFGKLVGFAALATMLAILFGGLTALQAAPQQSLIWTISLIAECWIIAAFSVLCVLTFNQVMPALSASIGFYFVARSIGALDLISNQPFNNTTQSQHVIHFMIECLSAVLPHLDTFTRTEWLVYDAGSWHALALLLGQTGIYLVLLAGAALIDLYRKNI
jgi:ABC-type transport system involved in multi-copper enzyme maturation permease subunit